MTDELLGTTRLWAIDQAEGAPREGVEADGAGAEREDVRVRVWNALCSDDDPALECPQCDGQIEFIGEGLLVCDMCNKEWSADDVAERNRL